MKFTGTLSVPGLGLSVPVEVELESAANPASEPETITDKPFRVDARQPPSAALPRLVTARQLSVLWGIKEQTVRSWAARGDIPSVKLKRLVLFDVDEMRAMLERAPRRGGAESAR